MQKQLEQFKSLIGPVVDVRGARFLLSWDQETMMPPGGVPGRANQMATLAGVEHRMFTDEGLGELLQDLTTHLDEIDYHSEEAGIIRVNWRNYQKQVKVPGDLISDIQRAAATGRQTWKQARAASDFSIFQPELEKMVELQKRYAAALGPTDNPYDALLDFFEPDMTYESISAVFNALKPRLKSLIDRISANADAVSDEVLHRHYPKERQLAFSEIIAADIGYRFENGRLDLSTHPFTSGSSYFDVRLTTRVDEHFLPSCVMATVHEAGHGIHGQNLRPSLYRTGVERYGLATAESQSRFYENVIGRSRAFWSRYFPILKERFPETLADVDLETFYRAVNKSEPSLIRVEADEVTYGMHIMLRFEIENDLINERLAVKDLPDAWNERMEAYLGVVPPDDAQGVLQDIHWSQGGYGYFPDYLLGSMLASQLWEGVLKAIPDAAGQVGQGQFGAINAWMRENIQQYGGVYTFHELAELATGAPFSADPYVNYLETKYSEVYGL